MDVTVKTIKENTSQLCKPLQQVLCDVSPHSILEYFIQYMESLGALNLVQCWLSIESFKSAQYQQVAGSSRQASAREDASSIVVLEGKCEQRSLSTANTGWSGDQLNLLMGSELGGGTVEKTTKGGEFQSPKGEAIFISHSDHAPSNFDNSIALNGPYQQLKDCDPSKQMKEHQQKGNILIYTTGIAGCASATDNEHISTSTGESSPGTDTESLQCESTGTTHCSRTDELPEHAPSGKVGSVRHSYPPQPVLGRVMSRQGSITIVTDAMGIYSTYIGLNATSPVGIPDDLRQEVEVSICPEDGIVSRSCFDKVQKFVYTLMEKRYYPNFLRHPYFCKYQLEYISSGKLTLLDFLLGENALFYFMEYIEQESESSLLEFWLMAESFRSHMASPGRVPNMETDTADAIAIYERYFSLQASQPLRMGDTVRLEIENKICDELGPRADSYVKAQQTAYDRMKESYYENFLESSIYLRFLDELVHTVRDLSPPSVASEGDSQQELFSEVESFDVNCDVDDPDSLWRRQTLPMRLGFVDAFGQYISEIDPAPQKSGKYGYEARKSGRWFRRTRDDEELAMKIARNIVQDILSLSTVAHHKDVVQ